MLSQACQVEPLLDDFIWLVVQFILKIEIYFLNVFPRSHFNADSIFESVRLTFSSLSLSLSLGSFDGKLIPIHFGYRVFTWVCYSVSRS